MSNSDLIEIYNGLISRNRDRRKRSLCEWGYALIKNCHKFRTKRPGNFYILLLQGVSNLNFIRDCLMYATAYHWAIPGLDSVALLCKNQRHIYMCGWIRTHQTDVFEQFFDFQRGTGCFKYYLADITLSVNSSWVKRNCRSKVKLWWCRYKPRRAQKSDWFTYYYLVK